jgi:hypothetical protein
LTDSSTALKIKVCLGALEPEELVASGLTSLLSAATNFKTQKRLADRERSAYTLLTE